MTMDQELSYFCYRCGEKNKLKLPMPTAPRYHHTSLTCAKCGNSTHILISHCPGCSRFVYWINDIAVPDLITGFARYMVHNMQALIDKAAVQGASIGIDTPSIYPINASCPCGETLSVEIVIPDLDWLAHLVLYQSQTSDRGQTGHLGFFRKQTIDTKSIIPQ